MSEQSAFFEAVRKGDQASVQERIAHHPDLVHAVDEHGKTGLHWAAELDHAGVAEALLDAGADLEARTSWGSTALEWAATMGSRRVADLLLTRGAGGLTLIVAAGLGMLDRVREIFTSEADLARHRRQGAPSTPDAYWPADSAHIRGDVLSDAFHAAARNGHTAVAGLLLDGGADVDAKGVFGGTALQWAAINGHAETVAFLRARGASLGVRDARFDATPAEWAAEGGHVDLAESLRAGA